jgi:Galactose oxidase, central domain
LIPTSDVKQELRIHGHKGDIFHDRAYFFGGYYYPDGSQSRIMTNDMFCIDLKTRAWGIQHSTIPDRHPSARKYHACAIAYNKFLVSGGKRKAKVILNDLWQFNLSRVR